MKLKCVAEGCEWESQELNEGLAKDTLVMHLQLVHQIEPAQPQVGGAGVKKPEKFPRPSIDQDSTLETWSEFLSSWDTLAELVPVILMISLMIMVSTIFCDHVTRTFDT